MNAEPRRKRMKTCNLLCNVTHSLFDEVSNLLASADVHTTASSYKGFGYNLIMKY